MLPFNWLLLWRRFPFSIIHVDIPTLPSSPFQVMLQFYWLDIWCFQTFIAEMKIRDEGKCTASQVTVTLYRVMLLWCNSVYALVRDVCRSVFVYTYGNITCADAILIAVCIDWHNVRPVQILRVISAVKSRCSATAFFTEVYGAVWSVAANRTTV
jgi:hypothetical protein